MEAGVYLIFPDSSLSSVDMYVSTFYYCCCVCLLDYFPKNLLYKPSKPLP